MIRAAILDDYQNVAMSFADWSPIAKDVEVKVFNEPFKSRDEAIKALQGFAVIVGMRERTPLPRASDRGAARPQAPDHHRRPNNSFDLKAAAERGVTVCGTGGFGSPTTGIVFGLILELTRRIGFENARLKAGEPWQVTIGPDLEGTDAGRRSASASSASARRRSAKAFGMNVIAWSQNLTPEKAADAGAELRLQGGAVRQGRRHHHPSGAERPLTRAGRRSRPRPHEADRLSDQHVARADHRRGGADRRAEGQAHRRRRPRRVRRRAFAARSSLPHDGQCRDHAASRLCQPTQNYAKYFPDIVKDIRAFLDGKPVRVVT